MDACRFLLSLSWSIRCGVVTHRLVCDHDWLECMEVIKILEDLDERDWECKATQVVETQNIGLVEHRCLQDPLHRPNYAEKALLGSCINIHINKDN